MPPDRPNVDPAAAFITACGRVLGLTPDHSSFRPHVDRGGRSTLTWNSFVKGMSGQSVESDYTSRFGAIPDWTTECHPHHQHLLRLASIQWGQPLPKLRPEAIVPAQGSEFDYRIPGPPRVHSPLWPGTASEAEMLAQLAASSEFERRLKQEFGIDRAGAMRSMMAHATLDASGGIALRDFITEEMSSHSAVVWRTANSTSDIDGGEEAWPIEIHEYCGVFQVRSPEHDDTGPFLSLADAQKFVFRNWPDAR